MKAITLVFLFFACTVSLHADILVNGDFADGRAHWKGDAKDPDATDNLSGPSPLGQQAPGTTSRPSAGKALFPNLP